MTDAIRTGSRRDRRLAALARRQHGAVSLPQLQALGLSSSGVRDRVAAGRLHRVHAGVYAVGHLLLSADACFMAAVLACGPGAVISHRSAADLHDLLPTSRAGVDVTSPRGRGRSRPGIDVHCVRALHPADVTTVRGIPSTTVARTLLDLAEVAGRRSAERGCERAEVLRVFDLREIEDLLRRARGRRGAPVLRAILAEGRIGQTLTRNELEERFLALCAAAGVQAPEVNVWLSLEDGPVEADFLWRAERLIVETDGYATHGTRPSFESDRRRDQRLMLAGWRVLRTTWRQVLREPDELAAAISAVLGRTEVEGRPVAVVA